MALDQAARVKDTLSSPFKYNPGIHEDWAGGLDGHIVRFEGRSDDFANINTPGDLAAARARTDWSMR
jgi:molybdopterin-guanine dinucleotide biosynthesis protein A